MPPAEHRVLVTLAEIYRQRRSGRTGQGVRDFVLDYEELLQSADCTSGDTRDCAERDLQEAEAAGVLVVERHKLGLPLRVRFSPQNEAALFTRIGLATPTSQRQVLAEIFEKACREEVPARWREGWREFCGTMAEAARSGASVAPFSREKADEVREILHLLPRLLAWETESLLRFASCRLCGNSKRLEELQNKLSTCLLRITEGHVQSLGDLGISENERALILHGPLRLSFASGDLDLGLLTAPCRVDRRDLQKAHIRTTARRMLTVENLSTLHELAKKDSGIILASSGSEGGFAHSAVITFLQALPVEVECFHFGDSDPKGFEILHDLRQRSGRAIASLGMGFDASVTGPELTPPDRKTIARLLESPLLTDIEKQALSVMLAAGHKGLYEQEGRPLPSLPN